MVLTSLRHDMTPPPLLSSAGFNIFLEVYQPQRHPEHGIPVAVTFTLLPEQRRRVGNRVRRRIIAARQRKRQRQRLLGKQPSYGSRWVLAVTTYSAKQPLFAVSQKPLASLFLLSCTKSSGCRWAHAPLFPGRWCRGPEMFPPFGNGSWRWNKSCTTTYYYVVAARTDERGALRRFPLLYLVGHVSAENGWSGKSLPCGRPS